MGLNVLYTKLGDLKCYEIKTYIFIFQIRIFRPPNYSGVAVFLVLFIFIAIFLYVRRNNLEFLYNKQMWAIIAVFICFAMVSGQMWNQIRGPPFFHRTKNGPVYINGGSHGQFVLESYIVAMLSILFKYITGYLFLNKVNNTLFNLQSS